MKKKYVKIDDIKAVIQSVKTMYHESVFPTPGEASSKASYVAAGARLACDAVLRQLSFVGVDVGNQKEDE